MKKITLGFLLGLVLATFFPAPVAAQMMMPVASHYPLQPSQVAGIAAEYRQGVGITHVANAVSQWDDQSGNDRHLTQATSAAQPTLQASGAIGFNGTSNYLKADAFTFIQPETVYLLANPITWTINDVLADGNASATMRFQALTSTPQIGIFAGGIVGNVSATLNTYSVLVAVFNGASSVLQLNNGTPVTDHAGAANAGGFTLGARGDGADAYANIEVKGVALFSTAHGAALRRRVVHFYQMRGGISPGSFLSPQQLVPQSMRDAIAANDVRFRRTA